MTRRPAPAGAVAYLRVSTEEQQLGPDAQRDTIRRWAADRGVEVLDWHEDRASGAAALDARPGLVAALGSLRRLRAAILVAARRDRLGRDVVLVAQVEQLAARAGARVETADGVGAGDGPEAALFRRIFDGFAEYERALIRLRTRAGLAVLRRRGDRYSGAPPFGLRHEGGRVVACPEEQAVVERILALRQAGRTVRDIVRRLQAEGVPARGGRWHATTVARVLAREASS